MARVLAEVCIVQLKTGFGTSIPCGFIQKSQRRLIGIEDAKIVDVANRNVNKAHLINSFIDSLFKI
jgi:hypothetical protein